MNQKISVIIPIKGKEPMLKRVLQNIPAEHEIIIVGNKQDINESVQNLPTQAKRVFVESGIRSELFNKGVEKAKGDIFLFLHPDTLIDTNVFEQIKKLPKQYKGGGIDIHFDDENSILKMIAWGSNKIRMRFFHIIYGDQSLFVRRDVFFFLNCYKEMVLFEDFDFSQRLKSVKGKLLFLKTGTTSARRFLRTGIVRQMLRNWYLVLLYLSGVSDKELKERYEK